MIDRRSIIRRLASRPSAATRAWKIATVVFAVTTALLWAHPRPSSGGASRQQSIQVMGSLFEQSLLLLLDALVFRIARSRGAAPDEMFAGHANLE